MVFELVETLSYFTEKMSSHLLCLSVTFPGPGINKSMFVLKTFCASNPPRYVCRWKLETTHMVNTDWFSWFIYSTLAYMYVNLYMHGDL